MSTNTITLKEYSYDTNKIEEKGEVSIYTLASSMSAEQFASLLSDFLNIGGKDFAVGEKIGNIERNDHRTLQGLIIRFALGIIVGLSDQEFTDARNEVPVATAKKIAKMLADGELNTGYLI